jgi:hypothetical protein
MSRKSKKSSRKAEEANLATEEDEDFIKFYNCPQEICACIDENGDHTRIARRFRYFYDQVRPKKVHPAVISLGPGKGRKSVDVLREMGVKHNCCQILFLEMTKTPVIDRSKNRLYDDTHKIIISEDTRELGFGYPSPDFPIL